MTSPDRRLTLLIVVSVAAHLVLLGWLVRPVPVPMTLPTLDVLLVSPKERQRSTRTADQTQPEVPPAAGEQPSRATDQADGSAASAPAPGVTPAADQLARRGNSNPATQPVLTTLPDIDYSRAVTSPKPMLAQPAPAPSSNPPDTVNSGVVLAIRQQLAKFQSYPPTARERGVEGAATVRFVISRSGRLVDAELLQSSGSRHLDQAAIKLVSDAAPYPPLPGVMRAGQLEVKIPIEYRLKPPAT